MFVKIISMIMTGILFLECASMSGASIAEVAKNGANDNENRISITVSEEIGDGQIIEYAYDIEDLSCRIIDVNGDVIYEGPIAQDSDLRFSLKAAAITRGGTMYWYPTDDSNGFKSGKGVAVNVSIETNVKASKTFGLTNGGDSSSGTEKNVSDILYTGTDGYWMLYVTNNSSLPIKVTGGTLNWGV